jgi:hypothetical protein
MRDGFLRKEIINRDYYAYVEDSVVGTYSCASTSVPNQIYCFGARLYMVTGDLIVQATYFMPQTSRIIFRNGLLNCLKAYALLQHSHHL